MKVILLVCAVFLSANAQRFVPGADPYNNIPNPYNFRYTANGDEGQSSHQETSDGQGRVQGSYSLNDAYGISRVVEYVADENGFRAVVRTNEPGTANQNPADVVIESTADGSVGAAPVRPPVRRVVNPRFAY